MKKINFILSLLLLWVVGAVSVGAKDIITDNYEELFSDKINASDPEFSPAIGWGHYTWGFEKNANGDLFHPTYSWGSDLMIDGVANTWISVATQTGKDACGDYQTDKDMLITPVIYGASSFYAIPTSSYSYSLSVYKMKEEKGKWVPDGEPLADLKSQIASYSVRKVTIPEVDGVRLGIYGSCIKMARFAAEQAAIPETKKLSLQNVSSIDRYANADAEGNYTITVSATVVNSGNLNITAADAPTVTLVDSKDNVLATQAIDGDFAVGATKDVQLSFTRSYAEYPDEETVSIAENIGNTKTVVGTYMPVSNAPKFTLTAKGETETLGADSQLYFGKTRAKVYKHYTVTNDGGSTLNITSVDLPEGFTSTISPETGLAVEPHTSQDFDLILSDEIVGVHEGVAKFNAGDLTKTVNVKGEVVPETTWTATFEDKKLPAGSRSEGESSYYQWSVDTYHKSSSIWATDNDKATLAIAAYDEAKFITPRLKFAEGETFELDASQNGGSYYEGKYGFSVYYSADGNTNWQLARTVAPSELPNQKSNYYYKPVRFIIDNIPAGSWYVGIAAMRAEIDNLAGGTLDPDAHDLKIKESRVPVGGEVNSAYTASLTLTNENSVDDPGTYNVNLVVDDEVVATTPGVEIVAGETATVEVSYTPHTTGTVKAKIELVATDADYTLATDETDVTVREEMAIGDVQAGIVEDYDYKAPINLDWAESESEILYPASKLTGLKKGDKIGKITFRAKSKYTAGKNVQLWMQNTEDETIATPFAEVSTDDMTKVFDGSITCTSPDGKGDVSGDYIVIDLTTPFVYDGNGLRLHVTAQHTTGSTSSYINVEVEKDKTLAYNRYCGSWNGPLSGRTYNAVPLPVAHFGVALDPVQYNGVVEDRCQNGIAGAGVTYKSGDVEYYALTDEDGKYTIDIIKSDLDYNATVEAPGYEDIVDASVAEATPAWQMEISPVALDNGEMYYLAASADVTKAELEEQADKVSVYELTKVADGKAVFNRATSMTKYKPYLIVSKVDDNEFDVDDDDCDLAFAEEYLYGTTDGSAVSAAWMHRVKLSPLTSGAKTFRLDDDKFRAVDFNDDEPLDVLFSQYTEPMEAVIQALADVDEFEIELDETPTTGITSVNADKADKGTVYSVEGMQVSKAGTNGLKPGLYIVNGKKVVKK